MRVARLLARRTGLFKEVAGQSYRLRATRVGTYQGWRESFSRELLPGECLGLHHSPITSHRSPVTIFSSGPTAPARAISPHQFDRAAAAAAQSEAYHVL